MKEDYLHKRLLNAHPQWGKKGISIDQCLKHEDIPRHYKVEYVDFMQAAYPTSNFGFVIKP
jgi:hypothetical protein